MYGPYSPQTEEDCSGTGATINLDGETTGNAPFSSSFNDGDDVAYTIVDGTTTVIGLGTFNTGTPDTITRNDLWNKVGTVVTKRPSSNVTLPGGGSAVCTCCDINALTDTTQNPAILKQFFGPGNEYSQSFGSFTANRLYYMPFYVHYARNFTEIGMEVTANAVASSNVRVGIYSPGNDGLPDQLIIDSGDIATDTTGMKTASVNYTLLPGLYWSVIIGSDAIDVAQNQTDDIYFNVGGEDNDTSSIGRVEVNRTFGALPTTADLTSPTYNTSSSLSVTGK